MGIPRGLSSFLGVHALITSQVPSLNINFSVKILNDVDIATLRLRQFFMNFIYVIVILHILIFEAAISRSEKM